MAINAEYPTAGPGTGRATANDPGHKIRRVLTAGTLTGDKVKNPAGEDLGKIEEIMIDLESGRVAYAVLSFGGFLGIGDKLFAVPWNVLSVDETNHEFLLDVPRETLQQAPGFDKDNWPDMADPSWESQIHTHYGKKPYWTADMTDAGDYAGDDRIDQPDRDRTTGESALTGSAPVSKSDRL